MRVARQLHMRSDTDKTHIFMLAIARRVAPDRTRLIDTHVKWAALDLLTESATIIFVVVVVFVRVPWLPTEIKTIDHSTPKLSMLNSTGNRGNRGWYVSRVLYKQRYSFFFHFKNTRTRLWFVCVPGTAVCFEYVREADRGREIEIERRTKHKHHSLYIYIYFIPTQCMLLCALGLARCDM